MILVTHFLSFQRGAKARIAQGEPGPQERRDVDGRENVAEERVANPDVCCNCAAEVSGPEDRAKDRRPRNEKQGEADELDDAEGEDDARRVADLRGPPRMRLVPAAPSWSRPSSGRERRSCSARVPSKRTRPLARQLRERRSLS